MVTPQSARYKAVNVYVEGGGSYRGEQRPLREAFTRLFGGVLGKLPMPRVVACGGRSNAFRDFEIALRSNKETLCLLLVDSEAPVKAGVGPWTHVRERRGDGWERPEAAGEDQLHLMVQMMETWIVADADALGRYYGKGFDAGALPTGRLEDVSKGDLEKKLTKATRATTKKGYKKSDGLALIGCVDPHRVEEACPSAKRFFTHLRRACKTLPDRRVPGAGRA